jgi:hypothetical protein
MKITHLTILLLLLTIFTSYGQEDCATKLSKAQKLYDAGQIEEIQQMLQPCIKDGFNKEEIQTAQKLIIQTNLFDKNSKAADSAMLQFLKKYPEYEIVPSDQAEFVQLFVTYKTRPVAAVGFVGGINYSYAVNNSNVTTADENSFTYTPLMSIHGGVAFRKAINNGFDISFDAIYQQSKYQFTGNSGPLKTTLTETQSSIMMPISVIYTTFQFGKLSIFGRAGATVGYMLNSTGDILSSSVDNTLSMSILELRNPIQVTGLVGLGINVNIPHSFLQFDIKYNLGFMEQVSKLNTLPTTNLYNNLYNYPTNGLKISNLAFSLGWYYKFYIPRKK